ncbi:MAG: UbiA family prenyltransferase [Candidatus Thermoplasmatota archaeon]|nr:UbiA family prenyltransferase [Candidatus Thermoplasmatota archaeon]
MSELDSNKHGEPFGKLTMKQPYGKKRFFPDHVRGYIDLLRPFTLLAPIIVSMSIIVASLVYNARFFGLEIPLNWWVTVGNASLTIALVNAASNALNQATDVEADLISKPYRPIPKKIIKPEEAQSLAYIFYLFALLRAVTINAWFGVFIFLIMMFTVTYSLPPRTKRFLFLNQVWIAIPRGFLGILAGWSVFGDPFQKLPLVMGTVATVFLIGGMSTKDISDSKADKLTGVHTLINTFGVKKAALISFPFMLCPFILIPFMINIGFIGSYFWPLTLFMFASCFIFYLMMKGDTESKTLENIHAWSIMYAEYIFFALGFAFLTIFSSSIDPPVGFF